MATVDVTANSKRTGGCCGRGQSRQRQQRRRLIESERSQLAAALQLVSDGNCRATLARHTLSRNVNHTRTSHHEPCGTSLNLSRGNLTGAMRGKRKIGKRSLCMWPAFLFASPRDEATQQHVSDSNGQHKVRDRLENFS